MARQESDREDLLREATALVERVEFERRPVGARVPNNSEFTLDSKSEEPIVVGFRRDGSGSIYIGADLMFQFNSKGELRRGFWQGLLVKADKGRLASLDRQRRDGQVQLLRHDFDDEETARYLALMRNNIDSIQQALDSGDYTVNGQVPEDADVIGRVREWLRSLPEEITVAKVPNVR